MQTPFKNKRPHLGVLALATVVLVTIASRMGSAQGTPAISDTDTANSEISISGFVHASVEANHNSQSIEEWMASGHLPEDVFENVRERAKSDPQAWNTLCEAFLGLDNVGLALFQHETEKPENQAVLNCLPALNTRFAAYLKEQRRELRAFSLAEHEENNWIDKSGEDEDRHLPSEEIEVDVSKGETLYGSPHGKEGYLKENQIAITIDDGPHPVYTRQILNTLKTYGVRVNFFSVGRPAKTWPALVKAEIAEGHLTGSHTMDHPDLAAVARGNLKKAYKEITDGREAVNAAAGVEIPFFRFPYGSGPHNTDLVDFVKKQGMTSFMWNMDSADWKIHSALDLFKNEKRQLDEYKGGIMLMHDIHPQTALALPMLLDELQHRHFSTILFVPH